MPQERPQAASLAGGVMYVTFTMPASGSADSLYNLISGVNVGASAVDQATGATPTAAKLLLVCNIKLTGYGTSQFKYGGAAGTTPITYAAGVDWASPCQNANQTFMSSVGSSFTMYAECYLE